MVLSSDARNDTIVLALLWTRLTQGVCSLAGIGYLPTHTYVLVEAEVTECREERG
jgi:hypothetical protein